MARPPAKPTAAPPRPLPARLRSGCHQGSPADEQDLHQRQREKNRKRIVGAGLDFERGADARAQSQAARVNEEEHRCRVGRRHHRADQYRFLPAEPERVAGKRGREHRTDQHADRCQGQGGPEHAAKGRKARAQAAVEQDERERHRSNQIGRAHVVKLDPKAALAGRHAEDEKDEQQRRPEAQRDEARQDAGEYQGCAKQDGKADGVERSHWDSSISTVPV